MQRASYKFGVEWIAVNDEVDTDHPDNDDAAKNISEYVSTSLLADLFGVPPEKVAADVIRKRRQLIARGEL